jgi:hypothetical protein
VLWLADELVVGVCDQFFEAGLHVHKRRDNLFGIPRRPQRPEEPEPSDK